MSEELYVNKRGFKCVRSQLAKTDGRDPQEHARAMSDAAGDAAAAKAALKNLKVHAPEYAEE